MHPAGWSLPVLILVLAGSGGVLLAAGVRFTKIVDEIADRTGVGEASAGAVLLGATTSLPWLVMLAAVWIGALTLAVADIIGGNTFDVLFVAAADVAYRGRSIYHAADQSAVFTTAMTVRLTHTCPGNARPRTATHRV